MSEGTNSAAKPTHLEPSELGTREYWDALYDRELSNHATNPSDTGTNWFDDSSAQDKMIQFLDDHFFSSSSSSSSPSEPRTTEEEEEEEGEGEGGQKEKEEMTKRQRVKHETSFLDLGTGNGELLFGLRDAGWGGRMLGVDYSERSVEFARRIEEARQERWSRRRRRQQPGAEEEGDDHDHDDDDDEEGDDDDDDDEEDEPSTEPVAFRRYDILNSAPTTLFRPQDTVSGDGDATAATTSGSSAAAGFDVVLDKGTFDAISLSASLDAHGRRISEGYRARVLPLVRTGGLLLVTSCNWTEAELEGWFGGGVREGDEDGHEDGAGGAGFEVAGRIQYRSFSFGGVQGQTISSLCFRKVVVTRAP